MEQKSYAVGQFVFLEGEESYDVYRIISGKVTISATSGGGQLVLAQLGPGDIFGEMSVVEEKPRSATARVIEDAVLEVLSPDDFANLLFNNPEAMVPYLASFFERLRNTNNRLLMETRRSSEDVPVADRHLQASGVVHADPDAPVAVGSVVNMQLKNDAVASLVSATEVSVDKFPYQIGRDAGGKQGALFARNDFVIHDQRPWNVSRSHAGIEREGDGFFVRDRGSTLGTIVNGTPIGLKTDSLTAPLKTGTNSLILGSAESPFKFELEVS